MTVQWWRKCLFAAQCIVKGILHHDVLIVIQMSFSIEEMQSLSLKPFVILLFALSGFFLRQSYLLNCKGSGHAAQTEGDDWSFFCVMRFHQIKETQLADSWTAAYRLPAAIKLSAAWHFRAKALLYLFFVHVLWLLLFLSLTPSVAKVRTLLLMVSNNFAL